MVEIDPVDIGWEESYRIMTTSVVPRPIGWVSTKASDGAENLAPYSHFNTVCPSPPVVMFSADNRDDVEKDSPTNAVETGEFVVNIVSQSMAEQMDRTSAELEPSQSEFDFANVEMAECVHVEPPRVRHAPVSMECVVYDFHDVYNNQMVLGEVKYFHVDDSLFTDGEIDMRKLNVVGRLGGPFYTSTDRIELQKSHWSTSDS